MVWVGASFAILTLPSSAQCINRYDKFDKTNSQTTAHRLMRNARLGERRAVGHKA